MFQIITISANTLLATVLYFLYYCWWNSSTDNFSFVLQVLQCSWFCDMRSAFLSISQVRCGNAVANHHVENESLRQKTKC
jgi:hypothetical protein